MDHMRCVLFLLFCAVGLQSALSINATLNLLPEAVQEGAVCLDGSSPGYYMRPGSASSKWRIHLMGGGWCGTASDCYNRSFTRLGSTKSYPKSAAFGGFLSDDPVVNPDFYDWNMVFVIYCDGASFAGDKSTPDYINGRYIYYRGYRILQAVFHDLNNSKDFYDATDVILTGCSAGGLAVYLHADFVRTMLPIKNIAKYKAFADAGYFLDLNTNISDGFNKLMKLQNIDEALMYGCKQEHSAADMWKCVFAPYIYKYIMTPLFVLNSEYDTAQLNGFYGIKCVPPNCSVHEMELIQQFKETFDQELGPVLSSNSSNGYFLDSCFIHCQTLADTPWSKFAANGHPMRESVGDWFYERPSSLGATRVKDCNYPCNPTCLAKQHKENSIEHHDLRF